MPKVVYTAAKGLYQESGSGFEVGGAPAYPSTISYGTLNASLDAFSAGTATPAGLNDGGLFFIISDMSQTKAYYFTDGDATTPATAPSQATVIAAYGSAVDAIVEVDITTTNGDSNNNNVGPLVKTVVEANTTNILVTSSGAAVKIEGTVPFAAAADPHVGNMSSSTWTVVNSGLGSAETYALNPYGLNYIDETGDPTANIGSGVIDAYTLEDGSVMGQEVVIIANSDAVNDSILITGKIQISTAGATGGASGIAGKTATVTGIASNTPSLKLMWEGSQWLVLGGHSITVA